MDFRGEKILSRGRRSGFQPFFRMVEDFMFLCIVRRKAKIRSRKKKKKRERQPPKKKKSPVVDVKKKAALGSANFTEI